MPLIRISPRLFIACALYAIGMVYYTDYLTAAPAGTVISIVAVAAILLVALFNFRVGTLGALLLLFTFPAFPRDLLDLYDGLDETGAALVFSSPKFLTFGGFSLVIWMFAGLAFTALMRGMWKGFRFQQSYVRRTVWLAFLFSAMLIAAATIASLSGTAVAPKEMISDLRFPIMLALGAVIGGEFIASCGSGNRAEQLILRLLISITAISGFKVILFVIDDRLAGGLFRLSFANPFEVIFPVVLALIFPGGRLYLSRVDTTILIALGLLASLPDGRGPILIDGVALIVLFVLTALCHRKQLPALALRSVALMGGIALLLCVVAASEPRLWNFLEYKSSFFHSKAFYQHMEHSPAVRIAEFKNVYAQNAARGYGVLIGRGAGGSFTYKNYSLQTPLGRSDYSITELARGIYFHPHTFATYWFLKGGLLGLGLYVYIFLRVSCEALARIRTGDDLLPIVVVLMIPAAVFESFWEPDFTLALAILFAVLAAGSRIRNLRTDFAEALIEQSTTEPPCGPTASVMPSFEICKL